MLLAASDEGLTIEQVNPCWFRTPVAPFAASLVEHTEVDLKELLRAFKELEQRFEVVIIEGVGGWLVPIRSDQFISDLAVALEAPVVIVAQNRLGCLNHTLLTLRSVESHGCSCAGIVLNDMNAVNDIASTTNAEVLAKVITIPIVPMLLESDTELVESWAAILPGAAKGGVASRTQV